MSQLKISLIFAAGICLGILIALIDDFASMKAQYDLGHAVGQKLALRMNPPSEELEIVCASLWVGAQNRIYMEREKK